MRWYKGIFGEKAQFNRGEWRWDFASGEELLLRHMDSPDDYWNYHGHEYPWIGWDELTNWPTIECYESMKTVCRSTNANVPRKIRCTANPWGVGHNWVKDYFIDPASPLEEVKNEEGQIRTRIHGELEENRHIIENDSEYVATLRNVSDPEKRKAWLSGRWDIVAGGMFDDLWDPDVHVLAPFEIPASWTITRSLDWGSSAPFSVGWWAESDGTEVEMRNGEERYFPRGTLVRVLEWYGWNGEPNQGIKATSREVARGIIERERQNHYLSDHPIKPGPADNQIWTKQDTSSSSIAENMAQEGVEWERADQSSGSRINGWELMRERMKASLQSPMDQPGLFVTNACRQFIRTIPTLPRSEKDPDDVDKQSEDHIADETRYRIMYKPARKGGSTVKVGGF